MIIYSPDGYEFTISLKISDVAPNLTMEAKIFIL